MDHHDGIDHGHDHDLSIHPHFSKHGDFSGSTTKNVFGGKDYHDSHGVLKGYNMKNIFGSHDYYNQDGHFLGHSVPPIGGKNFLSSDGHMQHSPSFLHSDHIHSMRMHMLDKIR